MHLSAAVPRITLRRLTASTCAQDAPKLFERQQVEPMSELDTAIVAWMVGINDNEFAFS
jgi:hypothetical protein